MINVEENQETIELKTLLHVLIKSLTDKNFKAVDSILLQIIKMKLFTENRYHELKINLVKLNIINTFILFEENIAMKKLEERFGVIPILEGKVKIGIFDRYSIVSKIKEIIYPTKFDNEYDISNLLGTFSIKANNYISSWKKNYLKSETENNALKPGELFLPIFLEYVLAANDAYLRDSTSAQSNIEDCCFKNDKITSLKSLNWQLLFTSKKSKKYKKDSYFAKAYINHDKKIILIAHKGSDCYEDIRIDLKYVFKRLWPDEYMEAANDFLRLVTEWHKYNNPSYTVIMTGHSLGAVIAELLACQHNIPAITLDSPGIKEIIESSSSKIDYKVQLLELAPIITIFGQCNIINTTNTHVGMQLCFPDHWFSRNKLGLAIANAFGGFWSIVKDRLKNKFIDVVKDKLSTIHELAYDDAVSVYKNYIIPVGTHFLTGFIEYFEHNYKEHGLQRVSSWPSGIQDGTTKAESSAEKIRLISLNFFPQFMQNVIKNYSFLARVNGSIFEKTKDFQAEHETFFKVLSIMHIADDVGRSRPYGNNVFLPNGNISPDEYWLYVNCYITQQRNKFLIKYLNKFCELFEKRKELFEQDSNKFSEPEEIDLIYRYMNIDDETGKVPIDYVKNQADFSKSIFEEEAETKNDKVVDAFQENLLFRRSLQQSPSKIKDILLKTIDNNKTPVYWCKLLNSGDLIFGGADAKVLDLKSGSYTSTLIKKGFPGVGACLFKLGNNEKIAGTSQTNFMSILDLKTGTFKSIKFDGAIQNIAQLDDNNLISSSSHSDATTTWDLIKIWDIQNDICVKSIKLQNNPYIKGSMVILCLQPLLTGEVLLGCADGSIRIYDIKNDNIKTIHNFDTSVNKILMLPNLKLVACGFGDGIIRIFDVKTWKCMQIMKEHSYMILCLELLSSGKHLASGSGDNTIKVWDLDSGICIKTLQGHSHYVYCMQSLPNGKLVSGSQDGTLKFWDLTEFMQDLEMPSKNKKNINSMKYI